MPLEFKQLLLVEDIPLNKLAKLADKILERDNDFLFG